jgi:COP9 signalosome complex subunit 1
MDHSMESSDGTEQPSFHTADAIAAPEASGSGTHDDLTVHLGAEDPFDWEAYIANYQGSTRIPRLIHIAKTAPDLRAATAQEAMRLIQETTNDTATYNSALAIRNTNANGQRLSDEQTVSADQDWIKDANKRSKVEGEKLDLELRNYQNNLIKESIRVSGAVNTDKSRCSSQLSADIENLSTRSLDGQSRSS